VVRTQADHSTLLSPAIYERQILPYDMEVIHSCRYSVMHLRLFLRILKAVLWTI
jgi:hypothetical protein